MPTTSIIVTTHNRPHLLPRAVASASDAGGEIEIVVVDDASTDETASVCGKLQGINYIRLDRNQGVAGARNVGLLSSKGEYVTFLDDDDVRLPDSLVEQVRLLESNADLALVYGQAIIGDDNGNPTGKSYPAQCPVGKIFWQLVERNFIPCGSAVFRRTSVLRAGLLNERIAGVDDWDLWVRLAELFEIAAVEHPVMIWRRSHPDSNQGTSDAARISTLATRQFRNWMKLPLARKATPEQRRRARAAFSENLAGHLIWDAGQSVSRKKTARAAGEVWLAARFHSRGLARVLKRSSK